MNASIMMPSDRRPTEHSDPQIVIDELQRAELEARNGLLQFDLGKKIIMEGMDRGAFKLRPSTLLSLHREALQGLTSSAGVWRSGPVKIGKSKHVPPAEHLVAALVEDMCDEVNNCWETQTAIWLAAFVMWRLNWIHPFTDGNGRTSRVASYVVLSSKLRALMPGTPEIPERITENRTPYFHALEAADERWEAVHKVDVSKLEHLLGGLLQEQLLSALQQAGGQQV